MKKLEKKLLAVAERMVRPMANPGPMAPSCQYIFYQPKRKHK